MNKRENYIDIAKGIAMILVIIGHCNYTNEYIRIWLYSFHMPLFFILSGMTFSINNKPNIKDFIKNKVNKLLIPYFWLSIFLWIMTTTISTISQGVYITYLTNFIGIFVGYRLTPFYFSMWFILVLLEAEIILYLLIKKISNFSNKLRNIIYCIIIFLNLYIGILLCKYIRGFLFSLDLLPFGLSFITFGYLIKENKSFFEKIFSKKIFLPIFIMANLIFTYLNYKVCGRVDLYLNNPGNYFWFLLESISGSLLIINICFLMKKNRIIEYIGKNSIVFYAFQNSLVIPIVSNFYAFLFSKLGLLNIKTILFILIIVTTLIILAIMNEIIKKYFSFALGKRT